VWWIKLGIRPERIIAGKPQRGAVAGIGWWAVYRFGQPLASIKAAVGKDVPGPRMPVLATGASAGTAATRGPARCATAGFR